MKSASRTARNIAGGTETRNPFGVMDVPNPNDQEVMQFSATTTLERSSDDQNAATWAVTDNTSPRDAVEGNWSSRWNGGADPTIEGDAPNKWKQGHAEVRITAKRIYLAFD